MVRFLRFCILTNTLTIGVTRPVSEITMIAVAVFRGTYVPDKVTNNYDEIFRWYFWCLLIKQAPKLFLA
ncbi:unnamed protein product [Heligmosomoides polygyrus]|uniref:Bestrophin homolog n=1 Tax=Heligmosomoides polygyrus TaxID=6339 RepID=A0A183FBZ9_HELPZ|nr:unnamed protein product [Heligmosomoides polygyrus]